MKRMYARGPIWPETNPVPVDDEDEKTKEHCR